MNRYWKLACLGLVMLAATGCVAQSEHDKLRMAFLREREQVVDLTARLEESLARIKAMQDARTPVADEGLQQRLEKALADKDRLERALSEAEDRLRKAGQDIVMLPPKIDQALRDLAAANPDLLTYDPRLGMVRINSDLTFDLGSVEVKAAAEATLAKLAGVIKSPDAQKYEALIVGHTDNVRIARPETRAKHPTNWHLSVHRAIAVKDVLDKAGVPAARMCVAGYGQYRPLVPNGPRGSQQNRRVELFLVPSTQTAVEAGPEVPAADAVKPTPAPTPAPAKPVELPEMFK